MSTSLYERLESRRLLAQVFAGVDTDGDTWTVNLTGAGTVQVTTSQGGNAGSLSLLEFDDTDGASKIVISVTKGATGDGELSAASIVGHTDLKSLSAPKVNLSASGSFGVQRLRTLTLGDVGESATMTITGGDTDLTDMTFRSLGGGVAPAINVAARVGTLKARDGFFAANFARGVNTMQFLVGTNIFVNIPVNAAFPLSIGKITSPNPITVDGTVGGRIGSISANFIGFGSPTTVGSIGTLKSTGQILGDLECGTVDSVQAGTEVQGEWVVDRVGSFKTQTAQGFALLLSTPDVTGKTLGSFKAVSVDDLNITVAQGGTAGFVKSVEIGTGTAVQLRAGSFGTIVCKGDLSANLAATDANAVKSLVSAKIAGTLSGTWEVVQDVGSVTAARTPAFDPWRLTGASDATAAEADVGKILFTDKTGEARLRLRVRAIGTIVTAGNGIIFGRFAGADAAGRTIGSLTSRVATFDINTSFLGGIGSLTLGGAQGGGISTEWLKTFKVTGAGGASGDLNDFAIQVRSAIPGSPLFLGSLDVKNGIIDSEIKVNGPIGTVAAGWLERSEIDSGTVNLIGILPPTASALSANSSIGSINIRRAFSATPGEEAISGSNVLARSIGKVAINGAIDVDHGGILFGFGAQTFTGLIKLRNPAGQTITPQVGPGPGDAHPFAGDFVFRVFV